MSQTDTQLQRIMPNGVMDTTEWGFTQAVVVPNKGNLIVLSGQPGWDSKGHLPTGHQAQIINAFKNLRVVIEGAGAKPENIVQIRVLMVDHHEELLGIVGEQNAKLFGVHLPASTFMPVPRLALDGMLFEIEATLYLPD